MNKFILLFIFVCIGCANRVKSYEVTGKTDTKSLRITKVVLFNGDEINFKCDSLRQTYTGREIRGEGKVDEVKRVIIGQTDKHEWFSMNIDNVTKIIDSENIEYYRDHFSLVTEKTQISSIYITPNVHFDYFDNSGHFYTTVIVVTGETTENKIVTIPAALIKRIDGTSPYRGRDNIEGILVFVLLGVALFAYALAQGLITTFS